MSKVVVISGHPNLSESNTNTEILDGLSSQISDIDIRKLDQLYPDYQIDIAVEQQALIDAQVIVLQFPFYWYSTPALLKKWLDDVFSYDFAYGSKGDKLKGKDFILSFTVGGPEESYTPLGYNHFGIEQLIRPLQQTCYLTGMNFIDPIYTHRMVYIPDVYNELSDVQQRARAHATRLVNQINGLLNSDTNLINKFIQQWFETFDQLPADSAFFTEQLAENIRLVMPEGEFIGCEGFRDWYEIAKSTFKPNCQHLVEQVQVNQLEENLYQVELRVRLIAESYQDSSLNGAQVNLLVNETWKMSVQDSKPIIHEYIIDVID